jgi:hypothetical protein
MQQKHVKLAAEEPVGGDWLLTALIAYFFTMLIFVFVDPPAMWQNSWRSLDSFVYCFVITILCGTLR